MHFKTASTCMDFSSQFYSLTPMDTQLHVHSILLTSFNTFLLTSDWKVPLLDYKLTDYNNTVTQVAVPF